MRGWSRPLIAACLAIGAYVSSPAAARDTTARPTRYVALETEAGRIVIGLYERQAPLSSAAFLVEVRAGRYDNGSFFRAVRANNDSSALPIQVVQAGAASPPPTIKAVAHEDTRKTGLRHVDGAVSLPRAALGTATGSSFFISIGPQPALDFGGMRNPDGQGFAVFGRVVCGMAVVRQIQAKPTTTDPSNPVMAGQIIAAPVLIRSAGITGKCSGK